MSKLPTPQEMEAKNKLEQRTKTREAIHQDIEIAIRRWAGKPVAVRMTITLNAFAPSLTEVEHLALLEDTISDPRYVKSGWSLNLQQAKGEIFVNLWDPLKKSC